MLNAVAGAAGKGVLRAVLTTKRNRDPCKIRDTLQPGRVRTALSRVLFSLHCECDVCTAYTKTITKLSVRALVRRPLR